MLSGISITCFAASYAVALALEASRLWFRSGVRGAVMLCFAIAGLAAQGMFLAYRAATASDTPLSSAFDWYLLAAWILAAVYVYLAVCHQRTAVGLFILPLVLALIGMAQAFASQRPFPQSRASQVWGTLHGVFILLGVVAVLVGFVQGLMFLLQANRLKRKLPPARGFYFPSLESLERASGRSIVFAVWMLGIGFISGIVLNAVNTQSQLDHIPWTDPVVWSSGILLAWMVAAATFSAVYRPARQGRKVAYLTLANFAFLLLTLTIRLLLPSEHRSQSAANGQPDAAAARTVQVIPRDMASPIASVAAGGWTSSEGQA